MARKPLIWYCKVSECKEPKTVSSKSLEMDGNQVVQFRLGNTKTVSVQAGKDPGVVLATSTKTVMNKDISRMAKAVANQVADNFYRSDLKIAALARFSAVHRSLKVAKSGVKKRNSDLAQRNLTEFKDEVDLLFLFYRVKNENGGSLVVCETPRAAAQRRRKALNFAFLRK